MIDTTKPIHINSLNFHKVINDKTILVDFWASWCSPCKAMEPVLDEIAKGFGNEVLIGKVNVDDNRSIALEFGITSIPTLILFRNGKEMKRMVGMQSKQAIIKVLADLK